MSDEDLRGLEHRAGRACAPRAVFPADDPRLYVASSSVSPDGSLVAVARRPQVGPIGWEVAVYGTAQGETLPVSGPADHVGLVSFTRDGRLAIFQDYGYWRIVEPRTGACTLSGGLAGDPDEDWFVAKAMSADGARAIGDFQRPIAGSFGNLRIAELASGKTDSVGVGARALGVPERDGELEGRGFGDIFAFSPDGSHLAGVADWRLRAGQDPRPEHRAIRIMDALPGPRLQVAAFDHGWFEEEVRIDFGRQGPYYGPSRRNHAIDALAFSPDGRALASAARDGSVRLTDAATGEPLWVAAAARPPVAAKAKPVKKARKWRPRPVSRVEVRPDKPRDDPRDRVFGAISVAPDGRVAVARLRHEESVPRPDAPPTRTLAVVVIGAEGRILGEATPVGAGTLEALLFLDDGRLHALTRDGERGKRLALRDLESILVPAQSE